MNIAAACIAVALGALALSPPAMARTCMALANGMIHCTDDAAPTPVTPPATVAPPVQTGPGYVSPNGNGPGVIGLFLDLKQAARRKKAAQLIADGKCDEARAYALRAGDLNLAQQVSNVCSDK